ncbi:hypothetical protein BGZ65_005112, partial [Modicella reniformis]
MDTDDLRHNSRDQHRPPVLFQSDDNDHQRQEQEEQEEHEELDSTDTSRHHSRQSSDPQPLSLGPPEQDIPTRRQHLDRDDLSNDDLDDEDLLHYYSYCSSRARKLGRRGALE